MEMGRFERSHRAVDDTHFAKTLRRPPAGIRASTADEWVETTCWLGEPVEQLAEHRLGPRMEMDFRFVRQRSGVASRVKICTATTCKGSKTV